MTREFWIWQWADGEFGSFIWPSKDSATLPHRHEVGHPIQLVPKSELDLALSQLAAEDRINSETLKVLEAVEKKLDAAMAAQEKS